ncbi:hypothetical protein [Salipiger sp.]|uniref:hypothetical protein n=1 Tax=Salipiger sp. TaxID=2078585 RepID=UPI003A97174C
MSNTDSFIDEVTEEVRRDRLFALMRKYGWIAVLAVILLVGAAAWREYALARDRAAAQDFGNAVLAALDTEDSAARIAALDAVEASEPGARAVLDMLKASEFAREGDGAKAVEALDAVSGSEDVPEIYREIASFKAVSRSDSGLSPEERRQRLDFLAQPGKPLHLLAVEQLAFLDIASGDKAAALERLRFIVEDAGTTPGLRQRASQLIVALGGEPEAG